MRANLSHENRFKTQGVEICSAVPGAMGQWPALAAVSWPLNSTRDDLQCHLHR